MKKAVIIFYLLSITLIYGCSKKELLKLNSKNKGKLNILILGKIIKGDLEGLKKELEKNEHNLNEIEGDKTYLIFALRTQNEEIINMLIEKGADPNLIINNKSILLDGLENKKVDGAKILIRNGKFIIDQKDIVEISKIVIKNEYTDILTLLIEKGLDINRKIGNKSLLDFCLDILSPKPRSALAIITAFNLHHSSSLIVELMRIYSSLISLPENDSRRKEMLELIKQKFKEEASWESNQFKKEEIKRTVLNKIATYDELNEEMNILLNERKDLNMSETIEINDLPILSAIRGAAFKNMLDLKESIISLDNKIKIGLNNFLVESIIFKSKMSGEQIDIISLDKIIKEFSIMGATFHPIKIEELKSIKTMKPAEMFKLKASKSTEKLLFDLINSKSEILEIILKYLNLSKNEIEILMNIALKNVESFKIVATFFNKILAKEEILEIILLENFNENFKIVQIKYIIEQNFEIKDKEKFTNNILNLIHKPFFIIFKEIKNEPFTAYINKNKENKSVALRKAILINDIVLLERIVDIFEISSNEINEYNKEFNLLDNAIREGNHDLARYLIKNNIEIGSGPNITEFIEKNYISGPETLINNVKNNYFNVIKFILDKNTIRINIRYIDKYNKTALDYAEENSELYNYLKEKNIRKAEEIMKEENKEKQKKKSEKKKDILKSPPVSKEKINLSSSNNSNVQVENKLTFKEAIKNSDFNLIESYIIEDNKKVFDILDKSDLVKEILELIDIEISNESGDNILFTAIKNNYLDTVKILISSEKFDIRDRDKNGDSILMTSISLKEANLFRYLIKISKEILNFTNNKGKNILDIAIENRKPLIINLILNNENFKRVNESKSLIDIIFSKEESLKIEILKILIKEDFKFEKEDIERLIKNKEDLSDNIKEILASRFEDLKILTIKDKREQDKEQDNKKEKVEKNRKVKIYNNSGWEVLKNSLSNEKDYQDILETLKELRSSTYLLKDVVKIKDIDNLYEIKIRRTRVLFLIDNQTIFILKIILNKDDAKTEAAIENAKDIIKNIKNGEYENKFEDLKFD